MPFAGEYREAMGLPKPGGIVGAFRVEEVHVGHEGVAPGRYEYPVTIVVSGKGGKDGVRKDFKELFARRRTIFSGYGNPYQCACGKMMVKSESAGRYRITARGSGTRVYLAEELGRFLEHLAHTGHLGKSAMIAGPETLIGEYLRHYQVEATRGVKAEDWRG